MDNQIYIKNVVTLNYVASKCTGCKMCIEVCPHAVFIMHEKKAMITNKDKCMECGACEKNCAYGAITVNSGVGCATAVIYGFFKGTEPNCDCGSDNNCC